MQGAVEQFRECIQGDRHDNDGSLAEILKQVRRSVQGSMHHIRGSVQGSMHHIRGSVQASMTLLTGFTQKSSVLPRVFENYTSSFTNLFIYQLL